MTNDDDDKISIHSKLRENKYNIHTFIVIGIPYWRDDGDWIILYRTWICRDYSFTAKQSFYR